MFFALAACALAATHVRGYTRKDCTYVAPHVRSSPNGTKADNYSTRGNVNPYTGKAGTKPATSSPSASQSAAAATPATGAPTQATNAVRSEAAPVTTATVVEPTVKSIAAVKIGMDKGMVIITAGAPSIKTDASWFYIDQGWIRFTDGRVSSVEAATTLTKTP